MAQEYFVVFFKPFPHCVYIHVYYLNKCIKVRLLTGVLSRGLRIAVAVAVTYKKSVSLFSMYVTP